MTKGKRRLNHSTRKALVGVGPFDDLDLPVPGAFQGGAQLRPGMAAVGVDMAQPGPARADGTQHPGRAVTVPGQDLHPVGALRAKGSP